MSVWARRRMEVMDAVDTVDTKAAGGSLTGFVRFRVGAGPVHTGIPPGWRLQRPGAVPPGAPPGRRGGAPMDAPERRGHTQCGSRARWRFRYRADLARAGGGPVTPGRLALSTPARPSMIIGRTTRRHHL